MKILGINFGKKEQPTDITHVEKSSVDITHVPFDSFSSSMSDLFGGDNPNLSTPFISERYQVNGMVLFGPDNLESSRLARLYSVSGLHAAICNLKKNMIGGAGYYFENEPKTAEEKLALYTFEKKNKVPKVLQLIDMDIVNHARVYVELLFDDEGKFIKFNRLNPTQVFHGARNAFGEIDTYYFAYDWEIQKQSVPVPAYKPGRKAKRMIYGYQLPHPYLKNYTAPTWAASANAIWVSGELPYMHKSYLVNSINPAFYLNFPRRLNKAAQESLKQTLNAAKHTKGNGKVLVFQSDNKDSMPEIGTIQTNGNDKLFTNTNAQIQEWICQAHEISPEIFGIKVNSSLGNPNTLKTYYKVFKTNVINPLRADIEEIMNDLMFIGGMPYHFKLNEFDMDFETQEPLKQDLVKNEINKEETE